MSKRTTRKGKNKDKAIKTDNNNSDNFSPESSFSSSIFESVNFSALFNPHDKYIHTGEKTSYDLMSYNLGIFNSLSTICKNLNMPYDKIYSSSNSKYSSLKKRKNTNGENNDENIINTSNDKDKDFVITDSIFKMLISESDSGNKARNRSTKKNKKESSSKKKSNKSDSLSLNEDDLNELLKDYAPMEVEK